MVYCRMHWLFCWYIRRVTWFNWFVGHWATIKRSKTSRRGCSLHMERRNNSYLMLCTWRSFLCQKCIYWKVRGTKGSQTCGRRTPFKSICEVTLGYFWDWGFSAETFLEWWAEGLLYPVSWELGERTSFLKSPVLEAEKSENLDPELSLANRSSFIWSRKRPGLSRKLPSFPSKSALSEGLRASVSTCLPYLLSSYWKS